jgi:deferrochelatase/peroxidase EfeB
MKPQDNGKPLPSRRGLLAAASGLAAGALVKLPFNSAANAAGANTDVASPPADKTGAKVEPFWGEHQGGIITRAQSHTYFAAFDFTCFKRDDVIEALRNWTAAAARMSKGDTAEPLGNDPSTPASDSGETLGLQPARLTVTFGLGAGLFTKDGKDRFGLASQRPEALLDMPRFPGDQLVDTRTGGDVSVQACADDPQVAFHAVRQLARLAYGAAQVRWTQTGFLPQFAPDQTPRNLMGFKDGTNNPSTSDPKAMEQFVWVGNDGPEWMRGGSYLIVRRIRIALEHWDRVSVAFQEQTIGREKYSGAPLGGKNEFDPVKLDANDKDGNPLIADNAHVRLASAESNDGARILRRPYSYNDGVNFTSERWPPWRQGMEYDAGLLFVSYQRDPRTGFIRLFDGMSKLDMLNQFVTHTGGGLFACPGGVAEGEFVGQRLFVPT